MKERILIIDDDIDFQRTLLMALKRAGYEATGVQNGGEALELAKTSFFELIVSDVRLQGMDGIDVLMRIRDIQQEEKCMIIIMSGYSDHDSLIRAIKLGVDDFIKKPFRMEEFLHSVARNIKNYRLEKEKEQYVSQIKDFNLELIDKNERMSAILSSLAEGVFTVNEKWEITHFNRMAEIITGYRREEVMGRNCSEVFYSDLCESICPLKASIERSERVLSIETNIRNKNGDKIPVMVSASVIKDSDGKIIGGVEVLRDITEQKHMMAELERSREEIRKWNEKLERRVKERTLELEMANKKNRDAQVQLLQSAKMAAVGQLGAGVAHELNNPLGGILGYSQFILRKINDSSNMNEDFVKCKKYVEHIEVESLRCKSIIENLLLFSKKPLFTKPEPISIRKVIENTLSLLEYQLSIPGIKIHVDFESDLPDVSGNMNRFQQVFTNFFINAQKAMPEGGDLTIAAKSSRIDGQGSKEYVTVEISDTGCGIPVNNMDKIFDAFFTTKQDNNSVGLGLFVSYQIIQEYQGMIEVKSEVGKGTTFFIHFNIEDE